MRIAILLTLALLCGTARAQLAEATVLVKVTISTEGTVAKAEIQKSSGHKEFDQAALDAAPKWQFKPAIKGGKAVESQAVIPVTFRLNADQPQKLNVLYLLTDDLRYDKLGCTGDKIVRTPNIDALAARGVLFRRSFVTTSICAVSRASILSGQYARRHGINDFATAFTADAFALTYPMLFKRAGYRVGFIGKFGVGKSLPAAEFDYWKGFPGQGNYFDKGAMGHMNQRMGDQALEFLAGQKKSSPWCLSISFKSPHAQDRAPREFPPDPRDENLYKDVNFVKAKTTDEKFFKLLPEAVQKSESRARFLLRFDTDEKYQATVRDYCRLITGIDREVGRIVEELRKLGMLENTIIVFTSDNGFFLGERGLADKWYLYEESVRVPLIVVDPRLPESKRGKTVDALALNIDHAPTLLDLTGQAIPKSMQGQSLRPWLEGEAKDWRSDFFYEHHTGVKIIPPSEGIRSQRWTYIRWMLPTPVEELYDLASDPLQETNLASDPAHRETLETLRGRWQKLQQELK